ncbi:DUF1877 family protein [Streptomyces sp. NPDC007369]|uniref:DUF1877 family protein n=1 Tax=Streptomyces sp. NPDC007369 TaxID=3154589 RepID=UPI00340E9412
MTPVMLESSSVSLSQWLADCLRAAYVSARRRRRPGRRCHSTGKAWHALSFLPDRIDLAAADVYPVVVWERGEPLEWVADCYRELALFFRAAARDGDAVLMWIS